MPITTTVFADDTTRPPQVTADHDAATDAIQITLTEPDQPDPVSAPRPARYLPQRGPLFTAEVRYNHGPSWPARPRAATARPIA